MRLPLRLLTAAACAGLLAAVFALYTRPDMAVVLAEQFWACFN
ncbi:MAG TPA: hypothetical protein VEA40_14305 [Ramlibacter sp.]|nr:hypothetical protein [Ramlibacter sp.]